MMTDQEQSKTSQIEQAPTEPIKAVPSPSSKLIPTDLRVLVLMFFVLLLGITLIMWAWRIGPFDTAIESTENSYVKGKTTVLSSQINGYIQEVLVTDFEHVKQGQPLIKIDARTYDQKVTQAESGVDEAKNNLSNQAQTIEQRKADVIAANAKVEQARAAYELANSQLSRYLQLSGGDAVSKSEQDKIKADAKNNLALLKQAEANVLVAQQALKTAQVAETGLKAQVTNAQAQYDQAVTTKDYSIISSPMAGQLGEVTPRVGQYVAAGTQLMYLIPAQRWIIANFKETQIANMKIGQKSSFTVDALNHEKFTGTVQEISPAAGSEFSVLKPDNTTGNFTKVVQRISVRIAIDENQKDLTRLGPGMSVVTSVDTSH